MSVATQDIPVIEDKKWAMPKPCLGLCVRYYSRCIMSENNTEVGFIAEVGERVVGIAIRGTIYDNVFHKDDPRIVNNNDLKQEIDGVWEFTQSDVDMKDRIDALEIEVEVIRALVSTFESKPKPKLKTD